MFLVILPCSVNQPVFIYHRYTTNSTTITNLNVYALQKNN